MITSLIPVCMGATDRLFTQTIFKNEASAYLCMDIDTPIHELALALKENRNGYIEYSKSIAYRLRNRIKGGADRYCLRYEATLLYGDFLLRVHKEPHFPRQYHFDFFREDMEKLRNRTNF